MPMYAHFLKSIHLSLIEKCALHSTFVMIATRSALWTVLYGGTVAVEIFTQSLFTCPTCYFSTHAVLLL